MFNMRVWFSYTQAAYLLIFTSISMNRSASGRAEPSPLKLTSCFTCICEIRKSDYTFTGLRVTWHTRERPTQVPPLRPAAACTIPAVFQNQNPARFLMWCPQSCLLKACEWTQWHKWDSGQLSRCFYCCGEISEQLWVSAFIPHSRLLGKTLAADTYKPLPALIALFQVRGKNMLWRTRTWWNILRVMNRLSEKHIFDRTETEKKEIDGFIYTSGSWITNIWGTLAVTG